MLAFIKAIKDLFVEMGVQQKDLDISMPGPQDFAVVGDELFMCKNFLNHPALQEFIYLTKFLEDVIVKKLNVNGCTRFISGVDFTKWRTTNIEEINSQWEAHADLHICTDWKEKLFAIFPEEENHGGGGFWGSTWEKFDRDLRAVIRLFEDFSFSMKVNASNTEGSVKGQKRMLSMFSDVSFLRNSPIGEIVEDFTNGNLDTSSWNWNTKKGQLVQMIKSQLGEDFSIDTYPFVADFVNNWYTNVVCDVEVHLLNGPTAFNHGFKTAGLGDFVNDIMDLLK